MPDYWSVPISTGSIDNLNDTIAKGPDFSFIGKLADSYFQGKDQAYTQRNRDVFQQGLPKDANGNIDWNQVSEQLAKAGGTGQAQNLVNLSNVGLARDALKQLGSSDIFSPVGSQPSTAVTSPSSATAVPSQPPQAPVKLASAQPNSPSDIPTATPAPPGQNITQPNETGYKVDYGPTQSGPLPNAPQPTQVAQAGPQGNMTEATAQLYDKRAADAARMATALATVNPAQAKVLQSLSEQWSKQSQIIRGAIAKNSEVTPEQKNASASGVGSPREYSTLTEGDKIDQQDFGKKYTAAQSLGQNAVTGIQKAQLLKNLTLQPGFYSGPFNENVKAFQQFKSIFGQDPSSALPAEAFNKVVNDMLIEQVRSLGQSGVGRVLMAEVNSMKQAIASLGITPQTNRALGEIVSRTYQQQQAIAQIARDVRGMRLPPGQYSKTLDERIQQYEQTHPLFTQNELQHPQLLGAPDAPPESAKWSPQQKQQWAASVGLKSGDPIRFNGQVVSVP